MTRSYYNDDWNWNFNVDLHYITIYTLNYSSFLIKSQKQSHFSEMATFSIHSIHSTKKKRKISDQDDISLITKEINQVYLSVKEGIFTDLEPHIHPISGRSSCLTRLYK